MPAFKLTYFNFDGGRGEPVRIAFHSAGIDFEDERLSFADFAAMRGTTRFNSLPVLEIDGAAVTQSNAMCRYVGRLAGLYPSDDTQALYCDEVLDALEHLTFHIGNTIGLEGDALRAAREKLADGWLPVYVKGLDQCLTRGGGQYFADKRLTMADIKAYLITRWLGSGQLDHIPKDIVQRVAPNLAGHGERIATESVVARYYASRR